jgi:hypothetical protein
MMAQSMKFQSIRSLLLSSLATLALACGAEPESRELVRGTTNLDEEIMVPAAAFAAQSLYTLPEGARLVADPSQSRFLVLTTEGARHYALADVVSCGTSLAVRVNDRIGCSRNASPTIGRSYLALARAAEETSAREILMAPEVELLLDASEGLPCATKPADFEAVLHRLGADLATEAGSSKALTWIPVRYGSPAMVAVPAALLNGGANDVSAYDYDYGAGATCTCSAGTCTLEGSLGAKWCDSANCTGTCTLTK